MSLRLGRSPLTSTGNPQLLGYGYTSSVCGEASLVMGIHSSATWQRSAQCAPGPFASRALAAGFCLVAASAACNAAEYGFSTYGLGQSVFSAGVTPPAGIYVTNLYAYYQGEIHSTVSFGGVTINTGAKAKAFSTGINVLYLPERKVFGGNLGLGVTIPVGHVDVAADVTIGL
jgi:hypothetical protein